MGILDDLGDVIRVVSPVANLLPDPGGDTVDGKGSTAAPTTPPKITGETGDIIDLKFLRDDAERRVIDEQRTVRDARGELGALKKTLSDPDATGPASADLILQYGAPGLAFFAEFLPGYLWWTKGSPADAKSTYEALTHKYEAEYGMSFSALRHDAALFSRAAQTTDTVNDKLRTASDRLTPHWQGDAAAQFATTIGGYFHANSVVQNDLRKTATSITAVVHALQTQLVNKATVVSNLYVSQLAGVTGPMVTELLIPVAKNKCGDHMRVAVLNMAHAKYSVHLDSDPTDDYDGRHPEKYGISSPFKPSGLALSDGIVATIAARDGLPAGSWWDLTDEGRDLASLLAAQWLDTVLKPQVERKLSLFNQTCKTTTEKVQQLFATFTRQAGAVKDPYHGLSEKVPTDHDPKDTGGDGSGGGTGTRPTFAVPGGGTGAGGSGGSGAGGGSSASVPTITVPGGTTSPTLATGDAGTTPTVAVPGGTAATTTTTPTTGTTGAVSTGGSNSGIDVPVPPVIPGPPVVAPNHTNRDGSVTLGRTSTGTIRFGKERRDGSIDVTETTKDGRTNRYRVAFGPSGDAVVTEGSAHARTNPDGSVTLGADRALVIGPDSGAAGFTVTQGTGAAATSWQVSYDHDGAPHVSAAADDPAGDAAGDTTDASADTTASAGLFGSGGTNGSDGSGGSGGSDGAAYTSSAGSDAGGQSGSGGSDGMHAAAQQDAQLGQGTQFGSQADTGQSGGGTDNGSGSGQGNGGNSGHPVGGVPLGAGAGRGGAGGGEELKHRYRPAGDRAVDDEELEQWDRLGPSIG